jgi:uncharacterized membrane protein
MAASIALVPAVVLVSGFVFGRFQVVSSLYVLAAFTAALTVLSLFRREACPPRDRFAVPAAGALVESVTQAFRIRSPRLSRSPTFQPESRRGLFLNVALGVSVVLLLGSVAGAYAYPAQGQTFTELYVVTQSDDGQFVAGDYPSEFDAGESRPVYPTVTNHEGASQTYTLVATLQRVERTDGGTSVTREAELTRVTRTLDDGETMRIEHDLRPTFGGDRLRVQYLLYVGDPPANPSTETAYRSTHLWISVDEGSTGGE